MSPSAARIGVVATLFVAALMAVVLRLWIVMVEQHDTWLLRSHQNRWAFRDVPSVRGALRDRHDRVLAYDEPTVDLHCLYSRFRRRHPIGAAVHGATIWLQQVTGDDSVRYGYGDGPLDPLAAYQAFVEMPVGWLRRGHLPQPLRNELLTAAVSVLAAGADWPRARVATAVLTAARASPRLRLDAVLPGVDPQALHDAFAATLRRFQGLDAWLSAHGGQVQLLHRLDEFRRQSLVQARVPVPEAEADQRQGYLYEELLRPLARDVPFEFAAMVGTARGGEPGLVLQPGLRRARAPLCGGSLAAMLGGVKDLDIAVPSPEWLQERIDEVLDAQALDQLVPADAVPDDGSLEDLRQAARNRYREVLRRQQRRGVFGVEAALDETLAGQPGLRFVERDAHAKEQLLWSHLRVLPGEDVALTFDLELQNLVDELAEVHRQHWQGLLAAAGGDPDKVDVGLCVLDAWSGDLLALGGAPLQIDGVPRVPAVSWRTSGDLGSIAKPFVLLEHLAAEVAGRPHRPWSGYDGCSGRFRFGGTTLNCSHAHWDEGRDPVVALAKSCNLFFFQMALGLEEAGVHRAFAAFGLAPSPEPALASRWQARPAELAVTAPRRATDRLLPQRAIGYGLEASPLHVARAYAGLLTGVLPTVGLRRQPRRGEALALDAEHLALVHEGLRQCVQRGTADHLPGLRDLGVLGKTGTAEVGGDRENNGWFAGWLPERGADGVQLCFCAVVYYVPDGHHGGDAAGGLIQDLLDRIRRDSTLAARYLPGGFR